MENKISKETAENIFEDFLNYYDLDEEDYTSDDDDIEERRAFRTSKRKIIRSIMKGALEITFDESLLITQHLESGEKIEYKEISGRAKVEMDKQKGNYGRLYALLGSLSGLGAKAITKLKTKDVSLAETLGYFFLLV